MAEFIEERLSVSVRNGSSFTDDYSVEVVTTASGGEYRRLIHPLPIRRWRLQFTMRRGDIGQLVKSLYDRCYKSFAGFRIRSEDDNSTNSDGTTAPTALDQTLIRLSAGVYQLVKRYGTGAELGIGRPARTIYKPVSGTTLVAVGGVSWPTGWTVDTTNGQIAFSANKTKAITSISKAANAVVGVVAHPFNIGDSVHFSSVGGMTQINGQRGTVSATTVDTVTVSINSTGYSTYTSGGVANTQPQASETVTGGCFFDLPARFDSSLELTGIGADIRDSGTVDVIEILNP